MSAQITYSASVFTTLTLKIRRKGDLMETGELLDKKLREIRTKREVLLQPAPNYESYKTMLERGFLVRYNYESTAIEGNPLTQIEHDGILNRDQCPNTDRMRSVYEAINHADAFCYVNQHAIEPLNEERLLTLHKLLMSHLLDGGKYRTCNITVRGATHPFPPYTELPQLMNQFFTGLEEKRLSLTKYELAAWAHEEFVSIHPFVDGNGRMARLIMNYILLSYDCLPISVPIEKKEEYFKMLDNYYTDRNIIPLVELIVQQEEREADCVIKVMEPLSYPLIIDYNELHNRYPLKEDYIKELRIIMDRYREEIEKRRGF